MLLSADHGKVEELIFLFGVIEGACHSQKLQVWKRVLKVCEKGSRGFGKLSATLVDAQ